MNVFERWEPVDDLPPTPCAGFIVTASCMARGPVIVAVYSGVVGNPPRDLEITFSSASAVLVHGELVHPSIEEPNETSPAIGGEGGFQRYTWPFLKVTTSGWLDGWGGSQLAPFAREDYTHYQLVSLDQIVDVASLGEVSARWIPGAAF